MTPPTADFIWFNGELVPWHKAQVHVMSHALHYGSSVFEGIRAYKTHKGVCIFKLKEHISRLFDSAKIYQLDIPFTQDQIIQACIDSVAQNGFESAYIRPLVFIGEIGMGMRTPETSKAEVMVAAFKWEKYLGDDAKSQGVDVCVSSWNRVAPNTLPATAKAGGNYLSSQLITLEAKRNGYHEGIGLDVNGMVSEGALQNLFIVKNNIIYTPQTSSSILVGLTRDTVITLAKNLGYEVREQPISRESLYLADEFFMTGTASEIVPVRSVDGVTIGDGHRGPVTAAMQQTFFGIFEGTTPNTDEWLTPVI
ncbi:branched-chain amino acid transaminase [Parashewanella tropica]|uniref:branched-chain amino acid transaminase n=1 Tax=Parashewanella tropica TaxID=2547970 RepID=UPI0010599B9E|nr:branched-chain amino acid transaminase [Parashewanella tropica]